MLQRAHRRVLRIGLIFGHEAPRALIDKYPRHLHVNFMRFARKPVGHALHAYPIWISRVCMLKSVGAMHMPHMPERRTEVLRHAYTIAGVRARRCIEYRMAFKKLRFQLTAALEAAARKYHATPCFDVLLPA